ncbi:MAG: SUKH-3 domain-containing protein [Pseudomonadota bacterium]
MPKFSKTTLKLLYQAGWFEKRKVNISEFIQVLHEEDFSLPKKVAQFLKSFGKLKIKQPGGDYFHFDVIEATLSVDTDWVKQDYSERVGEKLCIIGEAFNGYMTLCMSPQGEVYAGFDDTLVYVGTSGYDAIEALSLGYELAKVPELAPELITQFKDSIDEYVDKYVKAQFEHIQELMNQQKYSQVLRQGWGNVFKQRF